VLRPPLEQPVSFFQLLKDLVPSMRSHLLVTSLSCRGQQPKGGNTDRLSFATMTKTTTAKCNSLHIANSMGTRPVDHFCVGPESSSKHSCPGDSGGPFVYRGPKGTSRPIIAGIVSYGPFDYECGDKGNFDVATSIPYWRKWIDAQIKTYKLRR
jgi:secreted trypsin-like serine protease